MKKIITLVCFIFTLGLGASAQYYYSPNIDAGQNPGNLNQDDEYPVAGGIPAGWTSIHAGSAASPAWTSNRTIPFSFDFNGTAFTRYKVSTSGVLTFDTLAGTAPSYTRTAIPAAAIPDNSILIWGIRGTGANDNIVTKTFGTAPNRQFWIAFNSYTALAGCYTYWAIALEETSNKIYLVDMRNGACSLFLTLGVQINSTTAIQVFGSPNIPQHAAADPSPLDNTYYEFIPGSLPAANAELTSLTNAHFAVPPANVNIAGKITNLGAATITTFSVKYENSGTVYSDSITGVNIVSYQTYNFTHSTPFNVANPVAYPIKVWVELAGDAVQTDDTLNTLVSGLSFIPVKNIVFEEATGTWCGWCPRGTVFMDSLRTLHPDRAMLIAVHNADVMSDPTYDNAMGSTVGGYPSGHVDRKVMDTDPNTFITQYNNHINDTVPCDVSVASSYDQFTGDLTIDVSGHFAADLEGDFRLNAVVTEDGVTGTGDGTNANNLDYDQVNYYSFQVNNLPLAGAGHNWQTETDPVDAPNMVYDHVARAILGGYNGQPGSLPSSITANSTYTYGFTYNVTPGTDLTKLKVIGWVCDASTGEIFNSNRQDNVVGIRTNVKNTNHLTVYPNPSAGIIRVKSTVAGNNTMKVNVLNSLGETILGFEKMNFSNGQEIDLSKQSNGLYFLQFIDENNRISVNKVMINR